MSNSATVSTAIPGQHHSDPFFDWQKKRQHRYTDTCLFYPSAFTSAKRRSEGWVRRYSTSSIESGMASRNSSHTGLNSLHRRTLSLGTLSPTVQQRQDQLPALYDLITSPQQEITSQGSKDHRHKYHPSATEADLIALTTTTTTTVITSPLPSSATSTATPTSGSSNARHQNAMGTRLPLSKSSAAEVEYNSANLQQHTMIDLTRCRPTRTVRIERDYSRGDGVTRFSTEFPQELEGKVNATEFEHTITTINNILSNAEKLSLNLFDNIMECLTIYTWPMLFSTHYQRSIKQLMEFIESENKRMYHAKGMSISDPIRAAFLFVEIQLYD